jgi:hypothetical protein
MSNSRNFNAGPKEKIVYDKDELITLTRDDLAHRVANYSAAIFVATLITIRKDPDLLDLLSDPRVSDAKVREAFGSKQEEIAEGIYRGLHSQIFEEN